jgi:hypothetical protein
MRRLLSAARSWPDHTAETLAVDVPRAIGFQALVRVIAKT